MIDFELEELNENQDWLVLLQAYVARHEAYKALSKANPTPNSNEGRQEPISDGWIPRLTGIAGIADGRLSKIHGKLIALGFLKFQLSSREEGVRYQVSPLGKQALEYKRTAEANSSGSTLDQMDAA